MCIICDLKRRAYFIWQREGCPEGRALNNWLEAEQEEIRLRAYFIWERQGRPDGLAVDHWLEAERELAWEKQRAADSERRLALLRYQLELVEVLAIGVVFLVVGVAFAAAFARILRDEHPLTGLADTDHKSDQERRS